MFEINRRRNGDPVSEIMSLIASEPFFRQPLAGTIDETGGIAMDISEHEGKLIVTADMPGFEREQIDVQIHKGVLTVRGERSSESETKDKKFFRRERRFGSFSRSIALPGNVTEENVDAHFDNGVLTLVITQPEVAKPKKVAIR